MGQEKQSVRFEAKEWNAGGAKTIKTVFFRCHANIIIPGCADHTIYGESVEACVTMTDGGAGFDQEAMKSALRSVIARFKVPSHIFLYDSFPLNVNGKLDQHALHADMLTRLKRLAVDEELAGGVTVFDLVVKNSRYAIVPVTSLVSELAASIGFSRRRAGSVRLAVEEMLTERIMDAYSAAGNIRVKITLMPEWLRVSFSDSGTEYFIDKRRDTSMSAKIILKAVSDFLTDALEQVMKGLGLPLERTAVQRFTLPKTNWRDGME